MRWLPVAGGLVQLLTLLVWGRVRRRRWRAYDHEVATRRAAAIRGLPHVANGEGQ